MDDNVEDDLFILADLQFNFAKQTPDKEVYCDTKMSLFKVSATNEEIEREAEDLSISKNQLLPKWKKNVKFKLDKNFKLAH